MTASRSLSGNAWTVIAIAIIVAGVAVGMLHRLGMVPLWVSTLSTVLMAVGAIVTALAANRAFRRAEHG